MILEWIKVIGMCILLLLAISMLVIVFSMTIYIISCVIGGLLDKE